MDLPFAVDARGEEISHSYSGTSSLITASSQGSAFLPSTPLFDNAFHSPELAQSMIGERDDVEKIDFQEYITVDESDASEVDIIIDPGEPPQSDLVAEKQGDLLTVLLSGSTQDGEAIVIQCEQANQAAHLAVTAKREGDLSEALKHHSVAAKSFRDAAITSRDLDKNFSDSLLLLSQSQAKSAIALKDFLKQQHQAEGAPSSQKERLRAAVRGALVTYNEADLSDSIFLGKATKQPQPQLQSTTPHSATLNATPAATIIDIPATQNPVDEMMELERELKNMDSTLELGSSVASLGTRSTRLKQSQIEEGSFMVVPPAGTNTYLSSSAMWSRPRATKHLRTPPPLITCTPSATLQSSPQRVPSNHALDQSWWGNASTASVLAGSVITLSNNAAGRGESSSNNTKQLMRLLDSLKTLGEENTALLREVQEVEAARMEAKQTREQMKQFKSEYSKRFVVLKSALDKFRHNADTQCQSNNPVTSSEYVKKEASAEQLRKDEQLQRQEHLIRKLTADLKKEKEESRNKDGKLRKYERFYSEVKARSAEKARQREAQLQQKVPPNLNTRRVHGSRPR